MNNNIIYFGNLVDRVGFSRINYSMNISLKHKYIFFETPKAGCSTIKRRLHSIELLDTPFSSPENVHNRSTSPLIAPVQLPRKQLNDMLNNHNFFKFSFVRNPFTRTLSAFLDKIVRNEPQKLSFLKAAGRAESEFETQISFREFLDVLASTNPKQMDPHWAPQSQLIFFDLIDYSFVGRFESFEADWSVVSRMIFSREIREAAPPLQVVDMHRTNATNKLADFYDGECVDLVREIYKEDFLAFSYDTDPGI